MRSRRSKPVTGGIIACCELAQEPGSFNAGSLGGPWSMQSDGHVALSIPRAVSDKIGPEPECRKPCRLSSK